MITRLKATFNITCDCVTLVDLPAVDRPTKDVTWHTVAMASETRNSLGVVVKVTWGPFSSAVEGWTVDLSIDRVGWILLECLWVLSALCLSLKWGGRGGGGIDICSAQIYFKIINKLKK